METVLMGVTIVALALAIGMAAIAWRLLRADQERAAARAETLLAMATGPDPDVAPIPTPIAPIRTQLRDDSWDLRLRTPEPTPLAAFSQESAPLTTFSSESMFGATEE